MNTRPLTTVDRLQNILIRMNQIARRRRASGKTSQHLHGRCLRLSAAYLTLRATL